MQQAFVMQLHSDCEADYLKRHDEIWPELKTLLKQYGITNYHIYLHPTTLQLFGFLTVPDDFDGERLKREPIMQRWWKSMAPLMQTLPDSDEPTATPLQAMFYLE